LGAIKHINMKQTAVEWLLENLNSEPYSEEEFNYNSDCWDKALAMEQEQMMQCYEDGYNRVAKLIEDAAKQN